MTGKLFEALAKAQAEMGAALKSANNPHFRSKYADLASVREACMPALNKHGIAVVQRVVIDGGERAVETILAHASGETISDRVPLIVAKNDMQGLGSAITYARRYSLMGMAGIAPEDDDGNAAAAAPPDSDMRKPAQPSADEIAHEKAVTNALAAVASCQDGEELKAFWLTLVEEQKTVAGDPRVIRAKDERKGEILKARIREADDATSKGANAA